MQSMVMKMLLHFDRRVFFKKLSIGMKWDVCRFQDKPSRSISPLLQHSCRWHRLTELLSLFVACASISTVEVELQELLHGASFILPTFRLQRWREGPCNFSKHLFCELDDGCSIHHFVVGQDWNRDCADTGSDGLFSWHGLIRRGDMCGRNILFSWLQSHNRLDFSMHPVREY